MTDQRWDYLTLTRSNPGAFVEQYRKDGVATGHIVPHPQTFEGAVGDLGARGWELVAVTGQGDGERWHFKRAYAPGAAEAR